MIELLTVINISVALTYSERIKTLEWHCLNKPISSKQAYFDFGIQSNF